MSNDVNRIIAAVCHPSDWKSSATKLDLALCELSEESHVKRWKDVLHQIDQLLPMFYESNFINQRSRLRIVSIKLLNRLRLFIKKLQGAS